MKSSTLPDLLDKLLGHVKAFGTTEEWVSFTLIILFGIFLALTMKNRLAAFLKARFVKSEGGLGDKILRAVSGPFAIVIFGYFFLLAFDQFKKMPGSIWDRVHTIYPILNMVATFLFAFRSVDIGAEFFRRKFAGDGSTLDESWAKIVSIFGKFIVLVLGLMVTLQTLGIPILPLVTGAGVFGAAFALASQSTIANAIGSFEIMMDRLFKEGDRVSFGSYDGFVTKMGLRSIQLTALTGEKINLPNKDLVDKQIRNLSRRGRVCTTFTIGLTYSHTRPQIEAAMTLLQEIMAAHPRIMDPSVTFRYFGASTLDLLAVCWADYKTGGEFGQMTSELNLAIKEKFDGAGFAFAFPTTTIHLKTETVPSAQNEANPAPST